MSGNNTKRGSVDNQPSNAVVSPIVRKNSVRIPNAPAAQGGNSPNSKPENKSAVVQRRSMNNSQLAQVGNQVRQMIENSTVRPIQPARQYDVISMARAMNREQFAERVQQIFEPERDAALLAIQTGVYVTWRCPDQSHDCQRVGMNGRCFCGHLLGEHKQWDGNAIAVPCRIGGCSCRGFAWVPSRPEEVGEFWLRRRPDFDESTYRVKCKCKHSHEQHDPNGDRRCLVKGCARCSHFNSAFLCAACDRHWELHITFFENQSMRQREGRAIGDDFIPFAEAPGLKRIVMGGEDRGFDSLQDAIDDRYGPHQGSMQQASIGGGRKQFAIQAPRRQTMAALPEPPIPQGRPNRGGNSDAFPAPPR